MLWRVGFFVLFSGVYIYFLKYDFSSELDDLLKMPGRVQGPDWDGAYEGSAGLSRGLGSG